MNNSRQPHDLYWALLPCINSINSVGFDQFSKWFEPDDTMLSNKQKTDRK